MYRIRFIKFMIIWLLKKPQTLFSDYEMKLIAWPIFDCDITRMFLQTYSTLMGLARFQLVFNGEFRNFALKYRWVPVTTAESTKFIKSIRCFQRFSLKTKIICWNEKYFYVEHKFLVGETCYQRTIVEGLIRGPRGVLNPIEVFNKMGEQRSSPEMPQEISLWTESKKIVKA